MIVLSVAVLGAVSCKHGNRAQTTSHTVTDEGRVADGRAPPEPHQNAKPPQQASAAVRLVETSTDDPAGCNPVKLVDAAGKTVSLPAEVAEALTACTASLSPDARLLFYETGLELRTVDLRSGKDAQAAQFDERIDGASKLVWAPDGRQVALMVIIQENHPKPGRLWVWKVEDGVLGEPQKIDVDVHYECGGSCWPKDDFEFEDPRTISYTALADPTDPDSERIRRRVQIDLP